MPGYSYAPSGAGAAYMGMMGHLGPMRESRGPSPYGAASGGMYGGCAGVENNRRYMQRDPHPSNHRASSNTPRGTSLSNSSAPGNRGSQHSSRSPYASSYAPRSSYGSSGYRAPSHTPRGSSMFDHSASRDRGSQRQSGSSYYASSYAPRSSYASAPPSSVGSYSSYNSAKSYLTDYKPRGGWFPGFRNR